MVDDTFKDDSIILDILKRNLGKNNAKKVLKTLSGTYDSDSIILSLKKTLKGKIPETRLERLLKDFSDANTIVSDTEKEVSSETEISPERKYNIKKELGRGGMGAVYKVEEPSLEREVAMKKIIGSPTDSAVQRFIREAKITAKLDHPNIVTIHDFGLNEQGEYYFTMNHVKGEDLKEILNKIDSQDPKYIKKYGLNKKLQIYKGILDAIAFAHSKGIIHRDLKPANVMVGRFGEVQVMDWGLAKDNSKEDIVSDGEVKETRKGLTLDGQIMGSPGFMAPEQADGRTEDIDELSDVWSSGAILYNMLSLEKPIDGNSVREVVINTARGKVIPLRKKARNVPKELESIVMKALSPEKEDRYPNVERLHEDIDLYLERKPVSAHTYSWKTRIKKWTQRHPTLAISGGIAAILLSISGAVGGSLYTQKEEAKDKAKIETTRADDATLEKKAAQLEVRGQQKCEEILGRLKFLKLNKNYLDAFMEIIDEAIDSSENYWKPYFVLAKNCATFGEHEFAEKYFEKANHLYKKQFNKDSVEIFFEAGMHYGLPGELGGKGIEETALKYFEKAYSADPNTTFGKLSKAVALVIKTKNNLNKVEEYLPEAVNISKELTEDTIAKNIDATWLVRAWVLGSGSIWDLSDSFSKYENLPEARDALLHVVNENQGKITIRNFLAAIYDKLGEQDKAIKIYSNLLKIEESGILFNNRGRAYMNKGELEKAIEDYTKSINIDPTIPHWFRNRGSVYQESNQLDKAIEDYTNAIRLNPKDMNAYLNRGILFQKKSELDKATKDFEKVVSLDPCNSNAYVYRGVIYWLKDELNKAIEEYNKAINLNPKNASAYNNRGSAFGKKGELDKAIEDFKKVIQLDPQNANVYGNLGCTYHQKNELEKALLNYNKSIELNQYNGITYANRAECLIFFNRLDEAEADIKKSFSLNSDSAYIPLGQLHMKKGDYDKALLAFKEAYEKAPRYKSDIDKEMEKLKQKMKEK